MSPRTPREASRDLPARRRARGGLRLAVWLLLAAVAGSPSTLARAQDVSFDLKGTMNFRHVEVGGFPLDADGTPDRYSRRGEGVVRLRPKLSLSKRFFVAADVQLIGGQFYGQESGLAEGELLDPWRPERLEEHLQLREAYVQVPVFIGVARVGRMVSHWGLGLIANSGDRPGNPWAVRGHGDLTNRALLIVQPLRWWLKGRAREAVRVVLAADLLERDEFVDRPGGDLGWQVVGSVLWAEPRLQFGVYAAVRSVERPDGDKLDVTVLDIHGRWEERFADDRLEVGLEAEAVLLQGATTELVLDGQPREQEILQGAAAGRVRLRDRDTRIEAQLDVGWGSSDGDGTDGRLSAFRFDPSYRVGMILFQEVLGRVQAQSYQRIRDPAFVGQPPEGSELAITQGSVTGAAYVFPQIGWSAGWDACEGCLSAHLGAMVAFASGDVVDPYQSALAGGFNRNAFGKAQASGLLGYEVLAALDVSVDVPGMARLAVGAQYGLFRAGEALEDDTGGDPLGTVHKFRLTTDVTF